MLLVLFVLSAVAGCVFAVCLFLCELIVFHVGVCFSLKK